MTNPRGLFRAGPVVLLSAAALAPSCLPGTALGQELDVDPRATNLVRFVSQTTIQSFDGTTRRIDGYVMLGAMPLGPASVPGSDLYLEVDLASLDTGIGLRDRHMRDDYLEVEQYPFAAYKGRIAQVDTAAGGGFVVTADGTFTIHGVDRAMRVPCDVAAAGPGYRAKCTFRLLLSDFDIDIPKVMFLKLANEITMDLDFTVKPADGRTGDRT